MTRTEGEVMKALTCCELGGCKACPYVGVDDCTGDMAADAQELLKAQRHAGGNDTIIRLVMGALDKGGQHIMVSTDGNVSMWPDTVTARLVPEDDRDNHWHCSGCGTVFEAEARTYKYCPMCGAEFEEDNDETD